MGESDMERERGRGRKVLSFSEVVCIGGGGERR